MQSYIRLITGIDTEIYICIVQGRGTHLLTDMNVETATLGLSQHQPGTSKEILTNSGIAGTPSEIRFPGIARKVIAN
jgi:hypothetical protein